VCEIRDFKSGNALTPDGNIKPEIQLQLRAYGLILMELEPTTEVRLVVDDGEERELSFDSSSRATARNELDAILAEVPPPGVADARELATPGAGCFGCSTRHVCPGYRESAPSWWASYPAELDRAPNDTWGELLEVRPNPRAPTVDAWLRDVSNRRVRVDGLHERHGLGAESIGMRIALFDLEATGQTRGFDGQRYHPRSFHELPRDGRERRAWSVSMFAM
jgi:hypothetical protein